MSEQFSGGEKAKTFSEAEMGRIRDLADKVQGVTRWDLAKNCGAREDIDMVDGAQAAMEEIEALLGMPSLSMSLRGKQAPQSVGAKTFSLNDMQKLRSNLNAIENVFEWDLAADDEEELTMLNDARESLKALRGIL